MGKIKIVIFVVAGVILAIALSFLLINLFKPKVAGIHIESNPSATVYIDGVEAGRTPFEKTRKPGEVVIKLVPDSFEAPLAPYEAKVNLIAGVQAVIKRDFGETDGTSSGEIVSFEKIDKGQVSLAVVSVPDSAELLIDSTQRAFTPHRTTSILPGVHKLTIKADGFQEKEVDVRTYEGYKLTAVIKLAEAPAEGDTPAGSSGNVEVNTEEKKVEQVRILSTPTGFLRVRSEPSTTGEEVGTVEPESAFDLLETDEATGWYKIKFLQKGETQEKEGWISNQYAEVVEAASETSPTVAPAP